MMIFLCSDDALLAERCAGLFGGRNKVKQLHDVQQLKRQVTAAEDLLIIDLQACREKELPEMTSPALALAVIPVYDQAIRLLRRGVYGYGNRHMHHENLQQAVSAVRQGQVWMPPTIINRMITAASHSGPDQEEQTLLDKLSKREKEVARLVARGLSNKELADKLYISVRTVKAHLTSIFSKTGFRDRLELAIKMKHV
jgi:DNA-binding NarL/FixJ family response regulator